MSGLGSGRPRDPAIDEAVVQAAVEALRECGYSGFALEKVAARAHTTKASIRRRWPTRQRLVICALASLLDQPPVPDTGCTRCDLTRVVRLLSETLHDRLPVGILAPLVADCVGDADLSEQLETALVRPSRHAATKVIMRAVERGDVRADVDPDLLVDLLASVVYRRAMFIDPPIDRPAARRLVDVVLRGVAVDFEELVRISEQPAHRRHHAR